ncbi:hypothetical protein GGI43DRAFT_384922 [Trichoderma evansii]
MCQEHHTTAICASQKRHSMSVTCGNLHHVAKERILEVISSSEIIPISSLEAIRCEACTKREDEVGDRRSKQELVESPLLNRTAFQMPEEKEVFEAIIKNLWDGKAECPFHTAPSPNINSGTVDAVGDADVSDQTATETDTGTGDKIIVSLLAAKTPEATNGHSTGLKNNKQSNGLGRKVGIECSIWANAKDEPPKKQQHNNRRKSKGEIKSPPQSRTPHQPHKQESGGRKTSNVVVPMMAKAKNFLGNNLFTGA